MLKTLNLIDESALPEQRNISRTCLKPAVFSEQETYVPGFMKIMEQTVSILIRRCSMLNPKGYVDVYRVPKYAYYFWQATYPEKPMVFIQPHFWRSQYIGQKKDIVVKSNCDKVEVKVNGVSKGFQTPDQSNFHCVTFKDSTY